ncbi:MAG: DMT family transporter [Candidatus Hodarchaeota archaeon]
MESLQELIVLLFGFVIGLIAYIVLYLGKGIQKYAIEGLKVDKTIKSKNSGIWIVGLVLTTTYMLVQWVALLYAPINIIAPLGALGLIVLLIFSHRVLKESITKMEIIGVVLILIGLVVITLFNVNFEDITRDDFDLITFTWVTLTILGVEFLLIFISRFKKFKEIGIILGFSAGTLNAFQTVAKRVTSINDSTLNFIFIWLSLGLALFTLLMTQYAFAKGKANRVIPCYTAAEIILATFIGVIALSEIIVPAQIIGICIVIAGSVLLTAFKKEKEIPTE